MFRSFRVLILFVCSLILVSCGDKRKEPGIPAPAHLYSHQQMVGILSDVQILESAVNLKNAQNQTLNKKDTLLYSDIFKRRGTTYAEFQENFKYYASQPETLSLIYDDVISELTRRQAEENKKKKK